MTLDSLSLNMNNAPWLRPTQYMGFGDAMGYGYSSMPWLQPTMMNGFGGYPSFGMYNNYLSNIPSPTNNTIFGSNSSNAQVGDEVSLTQTERTEMKNEEKKDLAEENKAAKPGLVGALAGSAVFAAPAIAKGVKVQRNLPVTEMFFTDATSKLWESHPTTMREAQSVMQKFEKQYNKQKNRIIRNGGTINELNAARDLILGEMNDVLKTGEPEKIAQVAENIRKTNGSWWKRKPMTTAKVDIYLSAQDEAKKAADAAIAAGKTPKSLAVKGNSFFRHMGGGVGLGVGLLSGVAMYFMSEKPKVNEAKALAEETGDKSVYRKQLWQSITKCAIPTAVLTVGDAAGRWLTDKFIAKNAGKIAKGLVSNGTTKLGKWFAKKTGGKVAGKLCGKIAGKLCGKIAGNLTGKALGAAIGSIVPGLGTIVGLAIGCVADWAINKWVIPAIFGENDAVDDKKIEMKSDEDLLTNAYIKQKNGEEISQQAKLAIAKNPTFCAKVDQLITQQQQQQNQALYA